MSLWPLPADAVAPLPLDAISREVGAFARGRMPAWEAGYLEYHRKRYQDTLRLLPPGEGRRLLDVGSFPGHLSALAQVRGWDVSGLNNDIEGADVWTDFLERCRERKIQIVACEVEREPFPVPTASFDAVLFCELFEHLHLNPFHTLKEIFRVLRPGGLLILTTPNLRRVETLFRYLHGWGVQPPVSRTFRELLPSLLYHRHNREYTANELAYYLALQGKDLYDFRLDHVYFSDCLEGDPDIPNVLGQRLSGWERGLASALRRLVPSTRGQLIARAWRSDATLVPWEVLRDVDGFGPLTEDVQAVQGFTRRLTFPFRLTGPAARFEVPLPGGSGPTLVSLVVAHPAPEAASPLRTRWTLDGAPTMTLDLPPSPRAVRVRLLAPAGTGSRGAVRIGLSSSTWHDPWHGREVGLHVGGQWVLVERLPTPRAVDAALDRARAERRAEESADGWWLAAESLYVPGRAMPASLEMGRSEEDQLGLGWYHLEDWGQPGGIRWTGREAVAYFGTDGRATSLRVRAYSGDPRLGGVAGRLVVEHAPAAEGFQPVGELPFELPADRWEELAAPIPSTAGRLRLTILVDPPRIPRERIPESQDARELGLAVKRIWVA